MLKKPTLEISQFYSLVTRYIDIIFLSGQTQKLIKEDVDFASLVARSIGITNHLETKYDLGTEHNASRYIQAFYSLCQKQPEINDNDAIYKSLVEMTDYVNYLNIYLKNKINYNIDELERLINPKTSTNSSSEVNSNEPTQESTTTRNATMSDEDLLSRSGYTIHDVADQLVASQANVLLQRNIQKGIVFIYDKKNKFIPILKYLTVALFIVLFGLFLASYIILCLQNGKVYYQITENGTPVIKQGNLVSNIPYVQIILFLIIVLICYSIVRNIKNDNVKYFISWGWMSFYTSFILIIALTASETRVLLFNYSRFMNQFIDPAQSSYPPGGYNNLVNTIATWKILQYTIYGVIGLLVLIIITAVVINPKRDSARIRELLNKYATGIRNGSIDTSNLTTGFGGFNNTFF